MFASGDRPGSLTPLKWTGQNNIQTPVQFVTYPIAPVKNGTVIRLIVWLSSSSPSACKHLIRG
jgi:hypothetical protein